MRTIRIELDKPHAGQEQVIREAGRFNVLECGRRFGKTTLGNNLAIETALERMPVGWFAPSYKLLSEVWREICGILAPIEPKTIQQEKRLELMTGGTIEFWSLDQPDAGRGRKYKRVIIDEAGIVRSLEQAWQGAIRPTLADYKGDAWFLGTPKGRSNYFHRLFVKGQNQENGWKSWRLPTTANPNIDPTEIEAARQDMPESAFNQEFLGIPAEDGGNPFGLDAIARCQRDGLSSKPAIAYGIDLAKSHDWTVVCGLDEDGNTCLLERWQTDWGQTRRKIVGMIDQSPALVDSTGVGDPVVEDLCRECQNVEGFKFSNQSKQQLMEGLAADIQQTKIGFPKGWLVAEMESFEFEYFAGRVRYSAPAGLHDDGVCALALAAQKRRQVMGGAFEMVCEMPMAY